MFLLLTKLVALFSLVLFFFVLKFVFLKDANTLPILLYHNQLFSIVCVHGMYFGSQFYKKELNC